MQEADLIVERIFNKLTEEVHSLKFDNQEQVNLLEAKLKGNYFEILRNLLSKIEDRARDLLRMYSDVNLRSLKEIEENLKKSPYEKILSKFNDFKEDMKSMKIEFKSYELTVEKIGSEQSDLYKLYTMHDDSVQLYSKQKNMIQTIIKNFITSISTDSHIEKFLSSNLTKYVWKDYYENMIEPFADVSYGYAITCHKAQGSNFYNVFVDANDIFKNNKLDEMKKCLYTAFSRTQNKLYILI